MEILILSLICVFCFAMAAYAAAHETPEQREARREAVRTPKIRTKTVLGKRAVKRHLRDGWEIASVVRGTQLLQGYQVIMTKTTYK